MKKLKSESLIGENYTMAKLPNGKNHGTAKNKTAKTTKR
jgi:hypothetical protein